MISKNLVDPLALGLLKSEFASGDRIVVDADDGDLRFTRQRARARRGLIRERTRIVNGTRTAAFGL